MNLKKTFSFQNLAVLREGCELYIMRIMFVKYKDGFHIPFHCSSYSNLRIILAVGIFGLLLRLHIHCESNSKCKRCNLITCQRNQDSGFFWGVYFFGFNFFVFLFILGFFKIHFIVVICSEGLKSNRFYYP